MNIGSSEHQARGCTADAGAEPHQRESNPEASLALGAPEPLLTLSSEHSVMGSFHVFLCLILQKYIFHWLCE